MTAGTPEQRASSEADGRQPDRQLQVVAGDGEPRRVRSPGNPLPNAKQFLTEQHLTPDEDRLLLRHDGTWHTYNGRSWPELDPAALNRQLYAYFGAAQFWKDSPRKHEEGDWVDFAPTRHKVADLAHALEALCHHEHPPPGWLTDDPPAPADQLLVVANGLLHIPTRKLLPHTPQLFSRTALPYDYDPDATCAPRWEAFLESLWPDDPESIQALRMWFGYLLSGSTRQQKALYLVGPPRSGKGTIGRTARDLLGPDDTAAPEMATFASNFGLSGMIGKRLAVIGDARIRASDDEVVERILSITGEDALQVDRKHRQPWSGRLPTRLMMISNELPTLMDASGALARRFILLRLTRSFVENEDHQLEDVLKREMPAILNWALDGLDDLGRRGRLVTPQSARELVQELEDLSSPVSAFVRDRCVLGHDQEIPCEKLYNAWRRWCADEGRTHPGNAATFGKSLTAACPDLRRYRPRADDGSRTWVYQGIALQLEGPL